MAKQITRTGIVIGGAYTPRRDAAYAEPVEHPITTLGHRIVPWVAVFAAFCAALVILYGG